MKEIADIRENINKHWHILNINNKFRDAFKATPIIAFCKNTSLRPRQVIGVNRIRHNQKLLTLKQNVTKGECIPCNTSRCLSWQQIVGTTTTFGYYILLYFFYFLQ